MFGVAIILLIFGWTALDIYQFSLTTSESRVDVAIVLGASIYQDVPSPVFRERINHAVSLYNNGKVNYLIFTGGFGEGEKLSEAAVAKRYALGQGVPAERIFIEEQSRTTFQNLYFAKEIVDRNEFKTFVIVSDPLHMKRAMLMAADLKFDGARSSPTPTSRIISRSNQSKFLFEETRLLLAYQARRLLVRDVKDYELLNKRT